MIVINRRVTTWSRFQEIVNSMRRPGVEHYYNGTRSKVVAKNKGGVCLYTYIMRSPSKTDLERFSSFKWEVIG